MDISLRAYVGEKNFPEELFDPDLIFHFTSLDVAIEHILSTGKLKSSSLKNFSDPYENSLSDFTATVDIRAEKNIESSVFAHYRDFLEQYCKVLCFTGFKEDQDSIEVGPYKLPFTKPRHWAQYGHAQKGVCLALSKKELRANILRDFVHMRSSILLEDHISYDLDTGPPSKKSSFIIGSNPPTIKIILDKIIRNQGDIFFRKYEDFRDENEYRFVIIDPSKKHSGNDFCRIDNALKYIILGEKSPEAYHPSMLALTKLWNAKLGQLKHRGDPRMIQINEEIEPNKMM